MDFWGFHRGEGRWSKVSVFQKLLDNILQNFVNSILMPVPIGTQKEFLIESKSNGFWGVLLLLLNLEIFIWEVK